VTICQALLGIAADRMFDPNRSKVPLFPDFFHWVGGATLSVSALINIGLGMDLWHSSSIVWVTFSVWVGVVATIFATYEALKLFPTFGPILGFGHGEKGHVELQESGLGKEGSEQPYELYNKKIWNMNPNVMIGALQILFLITGIVLMTLCSVYLGEGDDDDHLVSADSSSDEIWSSLSYIR